MKILSIGNFNGLSNTCLHRNWALKKNADSVDEINSGSFAPTLFSKIIFHLFQIGFPLSLPDPNCVNLKIKKLIDNNTYDIVWIDKGLCINPSTLKYIKKNSPKTKIVSYSPDNMILRHNQSQNYLRCIPYYDIHFTTKSYIIDDLKKLGAKNVIFRNKQYESSFHYPRTLTAEEKNRLGADVGFVGAWEKERCNSILYLASHGIKVKVFGNGRWNEYKGTKNLEIYPAIYSEDYSKALQAFTISLCFLRKKNNDQQTSRSMEIPACGGFMLAERTPEHMQLFEEGVEADFFSTNEELLMKCKYYLSNKDKRDKISQAGLERCKKSGYSNNDSIKIMLNQVINI